MPWNENFLFLFYLLFVTGPQVLLQFFFLLKNYAQLREHEAVLTRNSVQIWRPRGCVA